jgi:hypothetical protein
MGHASQQWRERQAHRDRGLDLCHRRREFNFDDNIALDILGARTPFAEGMFDLIVSSLPSSSNPCTAPTPNLRSIAAPASKTAAVRWNFGCSGRTMSGDG